MKNPIKTFEPNTKGRDFVIGDLHGALPCLENLLKNLNFDPTVDRMFSVGDLVDRGPDSLKCLRLIRESWFHSVLANHEQMMLEAFIGGYMGQFWIQNGGMWGLNAAILAEVLQKRARWAALHPELTEEQVALDVPLPENITDEDYELIDLMGDVEELPYLITINRPDGSKFHVIHAELPPGHCDITDGMLSSPDSVMRLAKVQARDGDCFLWSRFLFANFYRANLSNTDKVIRTVAYKYRHSTGPFNDKLSHIISGHTILQRPVTLLGQTNIDTGAYGSFDSDARPWEALTCVDLGSWTFYQATPTEFRTVEPITVNKAAIDALRPEFEAVDKANNMSVGGTPVPAVDVIKGQS